MKKIVSLFLCVFIFAALVMCLTGCSANSDEEEIAGMVTGYFDAVLAMDFDESKTYVSGEADSFGRIYDDERECEYMTKVISKTSYEVGDVNIATSVANVSIKIVMPYLRPLGDERLTYEQLIDKIDSVTQTYESTILFSMTKDTYGDWVIAGTSTEILYNLFLSLDDDIELALFTEEDAENAVRSYIDTIARGDFTEAAAINTNYNNDIIYSSLGIRNAAADYGVDGYCAASAVYYSRLNYDIEFTEITEDKITMNINGYAPDLQAAMDAMMADVPTMSELYADMFEGMIRGTYTDASFGNNMMTRFGDFIQTADLIPFNRTVVVVMGTDGELKVDTGTGLGSFYTIEGDPQIQEEAADNAFDILVEQGRITEEENQIIQDYISGNISE